MGIGDKKEKRLKCKFKAPELERRSRNFSLKIEFVI
jgi:hypothetical protein